MKDETLLQVDEDGMPIGFAKWANKKLPNDIGSMTIAYCEDAWRAALQSGNSGQLNSANSFTDDELMGMAHGDNPVANAYRELLEFRRNSAGGNSAQPVTVPDGYVLVSADFIDTVKQAFKEVGGRKSFPGHAHDVPGVWDSDNGEKANKPCAQCVMWSKLHDMLASAPKAPADWITDEAINAAYEKHLYGIMSGTGNKRAAVDFLNECLATVMAKT